MPADGHSGRFRLSTLQIIALLATGAALIAGVVLQWRTESAEISQPAAPVSQRANATAPLVSESALPQDAALGRTKAMLEQQVVMADQTLCQYQYQTRYPNSSRPVSEHPDQVYRISRCWSVMRCGRPVVVPIARYKCSPARTACIWRKMKAQNLCWRQSVRWSETAAGSRKR
jgi:hypothetical protein